jgi:hypothetical protein
MLLIASSSKGNNLWSSNSWNRDMTNVWNRTGNSCELNASSKNQNHLR